MAKTRRSVLLFLVLVLSLKQAHLLLASGADSSVHLPSQYSTLRPPPPGGSYTDPAFGTAIKRISDSLNMVRADMGSGKVVEIGPEYSTMSPFNADNSRMLLEQFSYFGLYDGTGNYLHDLPFEVNAASQPRWSSSDANVLYFLRTNQLKSFNIATTESRVVHTFPEYSSISGAGESDISADGNHFVLAGDNRFVFVYEISSDSKGGVLDTGGHGFDSLYITPKNNVTITWLSVGAARYQGIEFFDRNMNFQRQVTKAGGHMDVAQDTNGDEVLLWTNSNEPGAICNNGIVKVRLADAKHTCLLELDWSLAVHVSAPDNSGWVFVETYDSSDIIPPSGWVRYTDELLQIKLDGSEVRRLAHHRSRPFNSYSYMPKVSTSHDGTKLIFGSNFGLQAQLNYPTEYRDAYLIDLGPSPAIVTQAPGGTTFSTTGADALKTGYAELSGTAGVPTAAAILGYRQNGVLVSETAVPASELIQSGRIGVEILGLVNTGLAIANPNTAPATISFYFTASSGAQGKSGTLVVPARGQTAHFLNEEPFGAGASFDGTLSFSSDLPIGALALRGYTNERSEFLMTTLVVANLAAANPATTMYFPQSSWGDGWKTEFLLVNPTDAWIGGSVDFPESVGPIDGQPASSPYSIPPRSSVKLFTTGVDTAIHSGSVRVNPVAGSVVPVGTAIFSFTRNGVRVSEAGVPLQAAGTTFRMYVESSPMIRSGIAIANTSTRDQQIVFELTRLDGTSAGLTGSLALPAETQRGLFLSEIPGFASLEANFKGILRIYAADHSSIAVCGLRGRWNERNDFIITTTQPIDEAAPAMNMAILPHIVDGGGYTTQFIEFSGSLTAPTTGTLRLYSQTGTSLGLTLN